MHFDLNTVEYVIITIVFGAIGGAVSGAFVADYFANKRAKRRRKVELLAFLNAWQSDFRANRPKYVPEANLRRGVFELFDDFRIELIAKATGVELDYCGIAQKTFQSLVTAITDMSPDQASGKENLHPKFEALIDFLRNN
jgi:hypothetical protein